MIEWFRGRYGRASDLDRAISRRVAQLLDIRHLPTDGEAREDAGRFRVADAPIAVDRRDEGNWPDRELPHHAGRR